MIPLMHAVRAIAIAIFVFPLPTLWAQSEFVDSRSKVVNVFLQDNFLNTKNCMVIGIIDEHGSRVFSAGALDNGTENKVDGDSIFELGSLTKPFTCLLMFDAASRNELKLADPVSKFVPADIQLPSWNGKRITLSNLASHESGLPWHPHGSKRRSIKELKSAADAVTIRDLYAHLAKVKLSRPPGTEYSYSNVGYALLGRAIEEAANSDYDSLVRDRICTPLKMANTSIALTPEQKLHRARGHWNDGARSEHVNFQAMAPAGSLHSTANDLLKFLAANLSHDDSPLTPLMDQMRGPPHHKLKRFGNTALGWKDNGVYNPPGTELWGHGGGGGGGGFGNLAFVGFDVKKRRGVVVLTNQMKINPNGVGWTLLQEMPFTRSNIARPVRKVVGIGIAALNKDRKSGNIIIAGVYPR
jgi:CubicO group peptidase (beta-lactamase class C family)